MNRLEIFDQHRSLLMSIAYRMLGSRDDAEDAVQETFLRWQKASEDEIQSPKSYLAAIVARFCIDQLRTSRAQREVYVGPWLPEPVVTSNDFEPSRKIELAESLTMAFLVILESLTATERAAFLLHEVFDYDFAETAAIVGKTEANCRQMVHRARERTASRSQRFHTSRQETEHVVSKFMEASMSGDLSGLMALIAPDAVMLSDGGGRTRAALNPVHGADAISRFVLGVVRKNIPSNAVQTFTEINGQPAFITSVEGQPIAATVLDVRDGAIQNMFVVVNPDKLKRIAEPPGFS